jgi:hypothetical protein
VAAETQAGEEKLVMGYDGRRFEFDSVQPHKVRRSGPITWSGASLTPYCEYI